jgi:membrane protease YdiL (CAAX protease family)
VAPVTSSIRVSFTLRLWYASPVLRRIFYNDAEKRLRAPWRLGLQITLLVALAVPFYLAFWSLARHPFWSAVMFLAKALAVTLSLIIAAWFFDRRRFSDLGLRLSRRWWLDCGFGFFLGALLMAGVFMVEYAAGWIEITATFQSDGPLPFGASILFMLVVFGLVGFYEETFSRGYGLRNLAEGFNLPFIGPQRAVVLAWVLSSVFFGIGHATNPHSGLISTLGVTPEAWTGGAFGPEAGLLGFLACLLGCLLVMLWVRGVDGQLRILSNIAIYRRPNR